MGFFDSLFEKKHCAVCGGEVTLFAANLADGKLCSACKRKLSPYYSHKKRTAAQIRRHLAYRDSNAVQLKKFDVTRKMQLEKHSLYIDETHGWFCISQREPSPQENPDILHLNWITGCEVIVNETEDERMHVDDKGRSVSYVPPRYTYTRTILLRIHLDDSPWLHSIQERAGFFSFEGRAPASYSHMLERAEEIRTLLLRLKDTAATQAAPKRTVICPFCGAPTIPDDFNRCEYCESTLTQV